MNNEPQPNESDDRRLAALRTALAPIVQYLEDDAITEVMLNPDGSIWIQKVGVGMVPTTTRMSPADTLRALRLVAVTMGHELNTATPSLAGRLPIWGARLQANIPPVVEAPIFAMRKPAKIIFTLQDYVTRKILTDAQADALRKAVLDRKTILVGGSTGSGKTTFLNALLQVLANTTNRLIIIEDTPELQVAAPNKVTFLVKPPTYTFQHAVFDCMRLFPDRILIGELRDGAATLQWVKSANTGHPGCMSSVHANDTRNMLTRLCSLIEESRDYSAPHGLVAETINVCVHIRNDSAHPAGRSISGIDRVLGWTRKDSTDEGTWLMEPLLKA